MKTAKLFNLGKAQAVRIPARFRIDAEEVEISQVGDALVLRPRPRTAASLFELARALLGDARIERPQQGDARPVEVLDP